MKPVLILIILLLAVNSYAYDFDFNKPRTLHDINHITFSCLGTAYFNHIGKMPYWKAALTVFAIGIAWESLDQMHKNGWFSHRFDKIFDKRYGFDHFDVLRNGIGVSLAFPIRRRR